MLLSSAAWPLKESVCPNTSALESLAFVEGRCKTITGGVLSITNERDITVLCPPLS